MSRQQFRTTPKRKQRVVRRTDVTLVSRPKFQRNFTNQVDMKGVEKKNIDTLIQTGLPLNAFTTPQLLTGIAQGVDVNQRVGRRVVLKSLDVRYRVQVSTLPANTGNINRIRTLIIYDKQTNGSIPALVDILSQTNFNAHMNLSNSDRFVVIADEYSEQRQYDNFQAPGASVISGHFFRKFNLETMFTGTGGQIVNITGGSLYFLCSSDAVTSALTDFGILADCRVRYVDV